MDGTQPITKLQDNNIKSTQFRTGVYDHNFLKFSPILGEKMAFFSKTNVMIKIL
jgi:hypothetical protein